MTVNEALEIIDQPEHHGDVLRLHEASRVLAVSFRKLRSTIREEIDGHERRLQAIEDHVSRVAASAALAGERGS